MKKLWKFLCQGWFLSLLGVISLSVVIWLIGPQIAFDDHYFLDDRFVRLAVILVIVIIWALYYFIKANRHAKASAALEEGIVADENLADDESHERASELREQFEDSLAFVKAGLKRRGGQTLYDIPWYVIIGPSGAGKSVLLQTSGLHFPNEQAKAVDGIGGTRNCKWWISEEGIVLDTAGRYVTHDHNPKADRAEWEEFVELLNTHRPRRPINGIIVAVSIGDVLDRYQHDENTRERESIAIRARIEKLQKEFRARLPVYLVFTKCDLVAGFQQFFSDMGREEREQGWGVTFPRETREGESVEFAKRFDQEFDELIGILNARLQHRVKEETQLEKRLTLYGFPKRIEQLKPTLVDIATVIFGPSRFDLAPMLRGIYLTSATQAGRPIDRLMSELERSFGLEEQSLPAHGGAGRSYFVTDMLRRVVFAERDIAGVNPRWERWLKWGQNGALAASVLIVAGGLAAYSISYSGNRQHVGEVNELITDYNNASSINVETIEFDKDSVVEPLNKLKAIVEVAEKHEDDVPMHLRLGLYQGKSLVSQAKSAYHRELNRLLLPRVGVHLGEYVYEASEEPAFQYDALKHYLMLEDSKRLDKDSQSTLTNWMDEYWSIRYEDDSDTHVALNTHLDELIQNIRSTEIDRQTVSAGRQDLLQHALVDLFYPILKRDINTEGNQPAIDVIGALGPTGKTVFRIKDTADFSGKVEPVFTKRLFPTFINETDVYAKKASDERWVLGFEDDGLNPVELDRLDVKLKERFVVEYIDTWFNVLNSLELFRFDNSDYGVQVVEALASRNNSPLRELLALVEEHTRLDDEKDVDDEDEESSRLKEAGDQFARRQARKVTQKLKITRYVGGRGGATTGESGEVTPKGAVTQAFSQFHEYIGTSEQQAPLDELLTVLASLSTNMDALNKGRVEDSAAIGRLNDIAVASPSPIKEWFQVLADKSKLVETAVVEDIDLSERKAARDERVRSIRKQWNDDKLAQCDSRLGGRYPVTRKETAEDLSLDEFANVFGPTGLLNGFFDSDLSELVDVKAGAWQWRLLDGVPLGFSSASLEQFRKARDIQKAFFVTKGDSPAAEFKFQPFDVPDNIETFTFSLDDHYIVYRHERIKSDTVSWPGNNDAHGVGFSILPTDEASQHRRAAEGDWALYRLFFGNDVSITPRTSDLYNVAFSAEGYTAIYELAWGQKLNPFSVAKYVEGFQCESL